MFAGKDETQFLINSPISSSGLPIPMKMPAGISVARVESPVAPPVSDAAAMVPFVYS